jgi:hypothetical protein
MAVELATDSGLVASVPKVLFQAPQKTATLPYAWDVTSDGKRFLFSAPAEQRKPFSLVLNWQAALKK